MSDLWLVIGGLVVFVAGAAAGFWLGVQAALVYMARLLEDMAEEEERATERRAAMLLRRRRAEE